MTTMMMFTDQETTKSEKQNAQQNASIVKSKIVQTRLFDSKTRSSTDAAYLSD